MEDFSKNSELGYFIQENSWPIYEMIKNDESENLKLIIEKKPELMNLPVFGSMGDNTLLHLTARENALKSCVTLLHLGARTDITSAGYITPLVVAAQYGNTSIVKSLLDTGAEPDGDPRGITTPLFVAIQGKHVTIAELILNEEIDVNRLQAKFNKTALDAAVSYHVNELIGLLKEKGARHSQETINAHSITGGGILLHIYEKLGPILSDEYAEHGISIRTALIGKGKQEVKYKLLFTFGNFTRTPHKEFLICLSHDWPVNKKIVDSDYKESFPMKCLLRFSDTYQHGGTVNEGSVFEKNDTHWCDLPWPNDIDALVAVDYSFDHQEVEQDLDNENVDLLLLTPIKYPKSGRPTESKLNEWIAKRRTSKWSAVALNLE